MNCKNCSKKLKEGENFCSNCGQKNIEKLNLKYILSQFVDDFFNVDSKILLTLKYLIIKPGLLSKEYMEGKRIRYAPPIRLYIVLSVIYFFLISVIDIKADDNSNSVQVGNPNEDTFFSISADTSSVDTVPTEKPFATINGQELGNLIPIAEAREMDYNGTLDYYLDSLTEGQGFMGYLSRQSVKAKVRGDSYNDILNNQISLFLLLFIPLLALLYASCFSRNKYGYIGHLVFNLHFNSFVIFLLCINQLTELFNLPKSINLGWTYFVIFIPQIYLIIAIMRFYERKWWTALYKYVFLIIGYAVLAFLFVGAVFMSSLVMS